MKQILPGLEAVTKDPYNLEVWQAYVYACAVYVLLLLYGALLVLLLHNIWFFLIEQRKYKVIPLTTFYVLAVLECLFRITL